MGNVQRLASKREALKIFRVERHNGLLQLVTEQVEHLQRQHRQGRVQRSQTIQRGPLTTQKQEETNTRVAQGQLRRRPRHKTSRHFLSMLLQYICDD